MKDIAELAVKYGVTGVLCAWLALTNMRLAEVERRLYNCLDTPRTRISHEYPVIPVRTYAVLQEPLRVKKNEKTYC